MMLPVFTLTPAQIGNLVTLARHRGPSLAALAREELAVASARLSLRVRYTARRVAKKIADRF